MSVEKEVKESKSARDDSESPSALFAIYNQPPQIIKRDKNYGISIKLQIQRLSIAAET